MIKTLASLLSLACLLVISGCVSSLTYVQPKPTVAHATVQGVQVRESLFTWRFNKIDAIDDKAVNSFFNVSPKLRIAPGKHTFVANVSFARGFASQQYYGLVEFNADIKAGVAYLVKSVVKGKSVQAWIEDPQGHRAGNVGSSGYNVIPQAQTVIIPVYSRR